MTSPRSSPSSPTPICPEPVVFDAACTRCDRLATFLAEVRRQHPGYHAAPVPPFGAASPALLVVGLAPGMHGANRTGRPFTGDHAGVLLYRTLHACGFSTAPVSTDAGDGLQLVDCRITNAVKCLPPGNKPSAAEVAECNGYLARELVELPAGAVVLALGGVAHRAVLRALGVAQKEHPFAHGAEHRLSDTLRLVDSYHCSRYNTQTGRLTTEMFEALMARVRELIDQNSGWQAKRKGG